MRYFYEEYICDCFFAIEIAQELLGKFSEEIEVDPEKKKLMERVTRYGHAANQLMEVEDIVQHATDKVGATVKSSLAEMHGGDCTAIACSCIRCWAEGQYLIPYTATWNKHEGHSLYYQYQAGRKEREPDNG